MGWGWVLLVQEHGLSARHLQFPEAALSFLIEGYTREAGVRSLERHVAALCRTVAVAVVAAPHGGYTRTVEGAAAAEGGAVEQAALGKAPAGGGSRASSPQVVVTEKWVEEVLGPVRFESHSDLAGRVGQPGTVAGLAWTAGELY